MGEDEPSALALGLMERVEAREPFSLFDCDLLKLSEYELIVLSRAAEKAGYTCWAKADDSQFTYLPPKPPSLSSPDPEAAQAEPRP